MMIADSLNSGNYPVRTEMAGVKNIPILNIFSTDNSKSKYFLMYETLSQVYSMNEDESKIIIVDESSTEEIESECVHKSVNRGKYANNDAKHEEPTITDDSVAKDPIYFNIFECLSNILNKLDTTCERACMETPRDNTIRNCT